MKYLKNIMNFKESLIQKIEPKRKEILIENVNFHRTNIKNLGEVILPDPTTGDFKLSVMPFENTGDWVSLPEGFKQWEESFNQILKMIPLQILKENYYQKIIDDILDKISIHGIQSLTQKELDVLNNSQDVEKLNKILGIYEIVANGIEFSVTDIKPEVYGEELRVWCNLQFLNKKLYGFLSGYPFEIGGDGFESYVFSLKNDLSYGMKEEEINIPQLFNLFTYLDNSLGFDVWENTIEHDKLYNFFGKIWEDVWIEFYKPLMTKNWFKERGEDY